MLGARCSPISTTFATRPENVLGLDVAEADALVELALDRDPFAAVTGQVADDVARLIPADRTRTIAGKLDPVSDLLTIKKLGQEVGNFSFSEHTLDRGPIEKLLLHVEDELQAFKLGAELVRGSRKEARESVLH